MRRDVLSIARSVLGEVDAELVLMRVLDSARELTGAQYGALGVLDESRAELTRFLTLGIDEATRQKLGALPKGRGVLGELIGNPVPLRLSDIGSHPHSYGFPAGHPPMRSFLGVPLFVSGEPFGNLYLTEKQGGQEFTEEDVEAVVMLAEFAGVAIDHARRYAASEQRRVKLQQTVEALEATIEITRTLSGQTDLGVILGLVAKRGRALVSARALVIEIERGGELVIAAGAGDVPAGVVGKRVRIEGTVASAAMRAGQVERLSDERTQTRFEQHGLGRFGLHARDGLVVPLVFRGNTYGVLVALDRLGDGESFGAESQRLLEAFAASAAMAVAAAQSAMEERRRQSMAAAEAERGRWARELHDETLQALASVRLGLVSARHAKTLEAMAGGIDQAVEQLQSDIESLRTLITDLRPAALDELGAEAAIVDLADRVARTGVAVDLNLDLAYGQGRALERHGPELETAVYRTVQEALTNAGKHGGAKRAVVEVIEDASTVRVSVRDDGQGFDPTVARTGFGLLGMRERVDLLEGTLTVDSAPGRGTTITAVYPVRRPPSHLASAPIAGLAKRA